MSWLLPGYCLVRQMYSLVQTSWNWSYFTVKLCVCVHQTSCLTYLPSSPEFPSIVPCKMNTHTDSSQSFYIVNTPRVIQHNKSLTHQTPVPVLQSFVSLLSSLSPPALSLLSSLLSSLSPQLSLSSALPPLSPLPQPSPPPLPPPPPLAPALSPLHPLSPPDSQLAA